MSGRSTVLFLATLAVIVACVCAIGVAVWGLIGELVEFMAALLVLSTTGGS